MRRVSLLLFVAIVLSTGCTALVVGSGRNPAELTPQAVRAQFEVLVAAENSDGTSSLTFRTHRKIAEPNSMIYALMGSVGTAGLGELYMFPIVMQRVTRTALFGSEVRVDYYPTGEVKSVSLNGDPVYSGPAPATEPPAPAKSAAVP